MLIVVFFAKHFIQLSLVLDLILDPTRFFFDPTTVFSIEVNRSGCRIGARRTARICVREAPRTPRVYGWFTARSVGRVWVRYEPRIAAAATAGERDHSRQRLLYRQQHGLRLQLRDCRRSTLAVTGTPEQCAAARTRRAGETR